MTTVISGRVSIRARPVRGARRRWNSGATARAGFQSARAPCGARDDASLYASAASTAFQSARAPCGARDELAEVGDGCGHAFQSARAPCGARDRRRWCVAIGRACFNPRAPRAGRATAGGSRRARIAARFNPRAPRAGRATPRTGAGSSRATGFNPRAPRAGRATFCCLRACGPLSRVSIRARPVRGARRHASSQHPLAAVVSIRARPVRGARLL